MTSCRVLVFAAAILLGLVPGHATAADVVVTIKPLHSIAASVMQGAGTPRLLVSGSASPHAFALKPSDAAALKKADLIVWVGPELETALEKSLANLARPRAVMTAMEIPGLKLVEAREGGVWAEHEEHASEHKGGSHGHDDHGRAGKQPEAREAGHKDHHEDPHIWLDLDNARIIAAAIAESLAGLDPANAGLYRTNAAAFSEKLEALDRELAEKTRALHGKPYVVFHDAYHYFEERYGLEPAGSITISPDRQPGARRVADIRDTIVERKALCVFAEPQFEPKLQKRLLQETGARAGVLDPLGAALPQGPDMYFALMQGLADDLARCLLP